MGFAGDPQKLNAAITRARQAEDYGVSSERNDKKSKHLQHIHHLHLRHSIILLSVWTAYRNSSKASLMQKRSGDSTRAQHTFVIHGYKGGDEYEALITWHQQQRSTQQQLETRIQVELAPNSSTLLYGYPPQS